MTEFESEVIPNDALITALREALPTLTVEEWHTGGDCMNVIVALEERDDGTVRRYLMFPEGGWLAGVEDGFGIYDDDDDDHDPPLLRPVWELTDAQQVAEWVRDILRNLRIIPAEES